MPKHTHLEVDEIVQNGQAFNLRRRMAMPDIRSSVRGLFEDLRVAKIDYCLVGGVALLAYIEGRNTQDIDLIVEPKQMGLLAWQASVRDRDFGTATYHGVQVDLLLTTNRLFAHVRRHERTEIVFENLTVPCATPAGLVLLKLYALPSLYRQGNKARAALYETDILMLLQGTSIDTKPLLELLRQHLAAHDVDELQRILDELSARRRFS